MQAPGYPAWSGVLFVRDRVLMFAAPMKAILLCAMLPLVSVAQESCQDPAPFAFGCETFPPEWPVSVYRCYTWVTGGSEVDYTFLVTASCSNDVLYELYDSECMLLDQNNDGHFALTPEQQYVVCVSIMCTSDGGIRTVCPYEQLTLPVELLSFTVSPTYGGVMARWSTASERNSWFFIVSRSSDGCEWKQIGDVNSYGDSSHRIDYVYVDGDPGPGLNYYRLTQVDRDGASSDLSIVTAFINPASSATGDFDLLGRRIK